MTKKVRMIFDMKGEKGEFLSSNVVYPVSDKFAKDLFISYITN